MPKASAMLCKNCDYCDTAVEQPDQHICRNEPGTVSVVPVQGITGPQIRVMTFWRPVNPQHDWCGRFLPKGTWRQ